MPLHGYGRNKVKVGWLYSAPIPRPPPIHLACTETKIQNQLINTAARPPLLCVRQIAPKCARRSLLLIYYWLMRWSNRKERSSCSLVLVNSDTYPKSHYVCNLGVKGECVAEMIDTLVVMQCSSSRRVAIWIKSMGGSSGYPTQFY
jgi:hypothetical protein